MNASYFYSRPCGRGDFLAEKGIKFDVEFLLTPLREGRRPRPIFLFPRLCISTHAPAGGATGHRIKGVKKARAYFYSRPCGRGDSARPARPHGLRYFYSRPCGRGDGSGLDEDVAARGFLLTPLREGRQPGVSKDLIRYDQFLLTPLREGRPERRKK